VGSAVFTTGLTSDAECRGEVVFGFTGALASYVVPAGVELVSVEAWAGGGGGAGPTRAEWSGENGAAGGYS
jgi:hypothetical protein